MSTGVDIIEPIADTRTARQVARDTRKHEAMARKRLTSRGATIAALIIAIFWTIPTFGLFVTSFRPGADVQSTGWWTIFTNPSFTLDNYEQALNSGGALVDITRFWFEQGSLDNERSVAKQLNYEVENRSVAGVASIVMRANDPNGMMRAVASRMTDAEIKAVADYTAGLR